MEVYRGILPLKQMASIYAVSAQSGRYERVADEPLSSIHVDWRADGREQCDDTVE